MDFLSVDDRFTLDSHDYLLKTTDEAQNKRISLVLFRHGDIIHVSSQPYDAELPEAKRRLLVLDYHQRHKEELGKLLQLHRQRRANAGATEVRYLVACGFLKYGMTGEAIVNLEQLVESAAATPLVFAALGNAYLRSQQYARALEYLRQAVSVKKKYADLHFGCGICEYHLQRLEKAVQAFSEAISTNPHFGEAYFYLGLSLLLNAKLGQKYELAANLVQRTTECFSKARVILPGLRCEAFDRGMGLLEQQNYEAALEVFAPLVAPVTHDKPEIIKYDFHLAVLEDAEHIRPEQAWQEIKRLAELTERYPNYPDLYHELGFAYSVLGVSVKSKAMVHFEKAIQINPNYEDAQKCLRLIRNDQRGFRTMLQAMLHMQR